MIKEFLNAWDERNKFLLEEFKTNRPDNYMDIVKKLIEIVINPYLKEHPNLGYPMEDGLDVDNITEINNGNYHGTIIYIIHYDTYQPDVDEYVYTHNYYGSCSGCDTFQAIEMGIYYDEEKSKEIITDEVAKDFHTLALHILQEFKPLAYNFEESGVNQ